MEKWVLFTIIYAILCGLFDASKKKALKNSSVYEVLAFFTTIAFLITAITSNNVFNISFMFLIFIFIKSLVLFVAWIMGIYVIDKVPLSIYGFLKPTTVIFSIIMGYMFFGEKITLMMTVGTIIVLIGLISINLVDDNKKKEAPLRLVILLLIMFFLSSLSGIIDKYIMSYITSMQLQFWCLFFLTIMFWIMILFRKEKIDLKSISNNYWILLAGILLFVADRFLFMANGYPQSKVSIMTVIKQLSTIEMVLLGKVMFNEKNIIKKLICSLVVITGIIIIFI